MGTVRNSSKRSYANASALVTMCKLLQDHSLSKRDFSNKLGITYETASKWIKLLHTAQLVHITEYKKPLHGTPAAKYEWGQGKDAVRPAPSPRKEYHARYRAKKAGKLHEYLLIKSVNQNHDSAYH